MKSNIIVSIVICSLFVITSCPTPDSSSGGNGSKPFIIPDTTKILDPETLNHLSAPMDIDGNLLFSGATGILENITYGDIIVSGTHTNSPNGLLRKVINKSTGADTVELQTSEASLEEAIQSGSIGMNTVLQSAELDTSGSKRGVSILSRCRSIPSRGLNIYLEEVEIIPGVLVSGEISFDIGLNFSLDIDWFTLENLTFTIDTDFDSNLEFHSTVSSTIDELIEVGRITFAPIDIQIASFPVVFLPVLSLNVGVNGEVSLDIATGVSQTAHLETGVMYDGSWRTVKDFTSSFEFENPAVDASCRIKGYLGPQMNILLYGMIGPYANLYGYVELEASGDGEDTAWGLYAGMELGVGVKIEVCSNTVADYSMSNLINYRKLLARGLGSGNSNWLLEKVSDIGDFHLEPDSCDIALDTLGNPHICYCSPFTINYDTYYMINYAYKSGSLWVIEEVVREQDEPFVWITGDVSIDLDSNNTPHILLIQDERKLIYCTRFQGQWIKETVTESLSDYGFIYDPVLAIDSGNTPHIVFLDNYIDAYGVRYAVKRSGTWSTTLIDSDDDGYNCDMMVDSQRKPHVLYSYNSDHDDLSAIRYASLSGTIWNRYDIESVDYSYAAIGGLSIMADSPGRPHVVYDFGDITYRYYNGSSWSEADIFDDSGSFYDFPSLCITGEGYPAIAYDTADYDLGGGVWTTTLKYAEKTETGWIVEHIDNNPRTGNGIKTAIDADDNIHVVYQDFSKNSIQYAKRLE